MDTHDRGSVENTNTFAIDPVTHICHSCDNTVSSIDDMIYFIEYEIEIHLTPEIKEACITPEGCNKTFALRRKPDTRGRENRTIIYKIDIENMNNKYHITVSTYIFLCTATPDIKKSSRKIKINKLSRKNTNTQEPVYAPFTDVQLKRIEWTMDTSIQMEIGYHTTYAIYR
ncbi:hypothetical protein WA158_001638 [Blastocystis sp. Blastoise]